MRVRLILTALIATVCFISGVAIAETEINITGQIRARSELSMKDFDPDANELQYTDLRTRVGIEAIIKDNTHAFVQFQDSRRFGDENLFGNRQSGTLNDGKNVDIHQAYIQIDRLWSEHFGAKIGRFELNLGNQRVFGSVGWHNVGRAWEGGLHWYDGDGFKATLMGLKVAELNGTQGNADFDIYGLYTTIKKANLDLFLVWEHNALIVNAIDDINALDRYNAGAYYHRTHNEFDFEMNFVYQFGTQPSADNMAELDIAAMMFTFETGYSFPGESEARIAAGIDYSSGDSDPADDKYKAYNNLYYTGHKFRGYMDYFVASEVPGLMDLMLRGKVQLAPGWVAKGDFHYFKAAQEYAGLDGNSKDVGAEIDLTVTTSKVDGVSITGGASIFLPKENFAAFADPDPGFWLFAMATADF